MTGDIIPDEFNKNDINVDVDVGFSRLVLTFLKIVIGGDGGGGGDDDDGDDDDDDDDSRR